MQDDEMREEKTNKQQSTLSAPTKSIMKKPGSLTLDSPPSTSVEPSCGFGTKRGKQQTLEDLLGESPGEKK